MNIFRRVGTPTENNCKLIFVFALLNKVLPPKESDTTMLRDDLKFITQIVFLYNRQIELTRSI